MDCKAKFFLIFGSSLVSFAYALTSPISQIYFMGLVSSSVLAFSNVITVALAAVVNSSVACEKAIQLYRKNFVYIVVIDVVCFCIISFMSVEHVTIRFIGFSIINAVSTNLWCIVIRDAVNQILSGDGLTKWNAYSHSYELWASFIGGLLAVVITDIDIEVCILFQCIANLVMGAGDIYAFRILKEDKEHESVLVNNQS